MTDSKKSEMDIRDKAILHQQRRLKQATQFTHKDSADLLPLDGLKRLGTSKDLQPHSIVQRRLLEGNINRLVAEGRDVSSRVRSPLAEEKVGRKEVREPKEEEEDEEEEEEESEEEEELSKSWKSLVVNCKCCDREVEATINTGYQQNVMSQECFRRLGLTEMQKISSKESCHRFPFDTTFMGQVEKLEIIIGSAKLECSALVVENETFELCLGLETLLNLKCCIDLERGFLKLGKSDEEIPFLEMSSEAQNETC
ncbi:nuclear receptor-interacting protein 2 [Polypterus senegalus]